MKRCPNCGELIGDNANECFMCHYNYSYGRVILPQERVLEREKAAQETQDKLNEREALENIKEKQIKKNPRYEYKMEVVTDNSSGEIDKTNIQRLLSEYAMKGWRLHSVFVNEIGKTSSAVTSNLLGFGINATIDQTILIFERCIKPLEE